MRSIQKHMLYMVGIIQLKAALKRSLKLEYKHNLACILKIYLILKHFLQPTLTSSNCLFTLMGAHVSMVLLLGIST